MQPAGMAGLPGPEQPKEQKKMKRWRRRDLNTNLLQVVGAWRVAARIWHMQKVAVA